MANLRHVCIYKISCAIKAHLKHVNHKAAVFIYHPDMSDIHTKLCLMPIPSVYRIEHFINIYFSMPLTINVTLKLLQCIQ